ncbi:hypothetical protein DQ04_12711000 [Trypanosoma grayi]|uniref:hypothetical protein n=1 Tax=Trypanosoma grayi TaxID=71804 RepID=UPI0004F43A69|nr:hypothetical protein DQ04_12711000 [Trypanosoma grayi]KEG06695.1 hypothetical protein DQ04_12711000 [Trypanosoma grayi]
MDETDNAVGRMGLPLRDFRGAAEARHDALRRRDGSESTQLQRKKNDLLRWLADISAAQGDTTPEDIEREELVAFFKGLSRQVSPRTRCAGTLSGVVTMQLGGEEEEGECGKASLAMQASLLSPASVPAGKTLWESPSSAPHTARSSQHGGATASRLSCGAVMSGTSGYSPARGPQQQQQQSPMLGAVLERGSTYPTLDGNGSSNSNNNIGSGRCDRRSAPELLLLSPTPLMLTPAPVALCLTPLERSGNTGDATTYVESSYATPPRQRIPPANTRFGRPPSTPHRERCRQYATPVDGSSSSGVVDATNGSLQLLKLSHPPKLCPPYAARLLDRATERYVAAAPMTTRATATTTPATTVKHGDQCHSAGENSFNDDGTSHQPKQQ